MAAPEEPPLPVHEVPLLGLDIAANASAKLEMGPGLHAVSNRDDACPFTIKFAPAMRPFNDYRFQELLRDDVDRRGTLQRLDVWDTGWVLVSRTAPRRAAPRAIVAAQTTINGVDYQCGAELDPERVDARRCVERACTSLRPASSPRLGLVTPTEAPLVVLSTTIWSMGIVGHVSLWRNGAVQYTGRQCARPFSTMVRAEEVRALMARMRAAGVLNLRSPRATEEVYDCNGDNFTVTLDGRTVELSLPCLGRGRDAAAIEALLEEIHRIVGPNPC